MKGNEIRSVCAYSMCGHVCVWERGIEKKYGEIAIVRKHSYREEERAYDNYSPCLFPWQLLPLHHHHSHVSACHFEVGGTGISYLTFLLQSNDQTHDDTWWRHHISQSPAVASLSPPSRLPYHPPSGKVPSHLWTSPTHCKTTINHFLFHSQVPFVCCWAQRRITQTDKHCFLFWWLLDCSTYVVLRPMMCMVASQPANTCCTSCLTGHSA